MTQQEQEQQELLDKAFVAMNEARDGKGTQAEGERSAAWKMLEAASWAVYGVAEVKDESKERAEGRRAYACARARGLLEEAGRELKEAQKGERSDA